MTASWSVSSLVWPAVEELASSLAHVARPASEAVDSRVPVHLPPVSEAMPPPAPKTKESATYQSLPGT
jgi:hypothetical protein